ncbi:CASTOR/POLLUX-related putative ion channel [Algoriphagus algorifonticola]|uniref:CASTOR/POLLUX-related putative ion channel n=1 Tax=Algoriphagus algorifonticola TaxID=2593007 RepID=UPI0011A97EE3|nr:ion channel DMI1 [Algoriphagus algorifonticola]
MKRLRIKESIKFFLERQFVKGAYVQLLYVAMLIGLISLIGGLLVLPSGEPTGNLGEAVWWAFLRLSDPGYLGDDEGNWRRFVSTILTVLGYVVFLGSMVAIITTWMNTKIRNLEQGFTPVAAKNHILILGWNSKTSYTVGEIIQSVGRLRRFLKFYGARRLNLIILAEDVTPEHVQELRSNPLIGKAADDIVLRSGIPIDPEDLKRVDSLNAAAIIIPSSSYTDHELVTPDVETIKTLLSLNAAAEESSGSQNFPYVVAEIQDDNKIDAAYRAYSGPMEVIGSNTIISRLIAQNIRLQGLSVVYNELLSHSVHNNLYCREYPEVKGKTIHDLRPAFPKAVILGLVRYNGEEPTPMLNMSPEFILEENDRLVFMARSSSDIELKTNIANNPEPPIQIKEKLKVEEQSGVVKILILGWNYHIPALVRELSTYEDEYYDITIVAVYPKEKREAKLEKIKSISERIRIQHVVEDFVNDNILQKLDIPAFDNIILVSSGRILEKEEADARTIVGYVLLEELLEKLNKKPNVLLELSDPHNETLLRKYKAEVIISPLILSNLLAGTALQREVNSIFKELFTAGGAEIIFRSIQEYGLNPGQIPFRQLEDKASEFGEIALGIYKPNSLKKEQQLILNPEKNRNLEISSEVLLVVLTTVY